MVDDLWRSTDGTDLKAEVIVSNVSHVSQTLWQALNLQLRLSPEQKM